MPEENQSSPNGDFLNKMISAGGIKGFSARISMPRDRCFSRDPMCTGIVTANTLQPSGSVVILQVRVHHGTRRRKGRRRPTSSRCETRALRSSRSRDRKSRGRASPRSPIVLIGLADHRSYTVTRPLIISTALHL